MINILKDIKWISDNKKELKTFFKKAFGFLNRIVSVCIIVVVTGWVFDAKTGKLTSFKNSCDTIFVAAKRLPIIEAKQNLLILEQDKITEKVNQIEREVKQNTINVYNLKEETQTNFYLMKKYQDFSIEQMKDIWHFNNSYKKTCAVNDSTLTFR